MTHREESIADVKDWFKNHKATLKDENTLVFRDPKSFCYAMHYIIYENRLFITGDTIDAVFVWYDQLTFEWLAGLNLDYFQGKCQCANQSECGMVWDSDVAMTELKDRVARNIGEFLIEDDEAPEERYYTPKPEDIILDFNVEEALYSQFTWGLYLQDNEELEFTFKCPEKLAKHDPPTYSFEASEEWNIGMTVGNCMVAAWLGIKLAMKDLESK